MIKAKAFDGSAPVGKMLSFNLSEAVDPIQFSLTVNDALRQQGSSAEMIFGFREIIAYVSRFVTLKTGDLIFTGTPAGVAAVNIGDRLKASIGDLCLLDFEVK